MIKLPVLLLLTISFVASYSQPINQIITVADVRRVESTLSADSMLGRKAFSPAANKAADFISNEFKKIGLSTLNGSTGYKQSFTMVSPRVISVSATINGTSIDSKNVVAVSSAEELKITESSGYKTRHIKAGAQYRKEIADCFNSKENLVVFVDSSFAQNFQRLNYRGQTLLKSARNLVFILGDGDNTHFNINIRQALTEQEGSNVAGVIPGKNKIEELVIFSGHYDHLGIAKNGPDTIYNGANDDASGVTAVIELAKYYKTLHNNQRTLVFVAFTAEEMGGFGSQYFSSILQPEKVVAMFNIEMIGTESKWGKNSAYITGFEKTDLGIILQKNLQGTNFSFYPDPYTSQELFYRSDNATLARLGVPAHTISTSKMDNELNYHKVSDEVGTLDLDNMTEIIKSIVMSAQTIVNGKDTPLRVKSEDLAR